MTDRAVSREKRIVHTSLIGIAANLGLAGFKALIGFFSHSIAVMLDAVNNLTDALSSVITILGARYSAKPADRKHPFGHGRIEYFASELIAILVIYAGVTALIESVKKIIDSFGPNPEKPDYELVALIIIAVAVAVKLVLGTFFKKRGRELHSDALVNSGEDARLDAVISASTLVAALLTMLFGIWQIEAWLGAVISLFIIRSGLTMLLDTLSQLLGRRADSDFSRGLKETICSVDGVMGAYDLYLTDYGPDRTMGSVHIEVPDTLTAREIDVLTRTVQETCYEKHGIILTAVGIYSHNTASDEAARIREEIRRQVMSREGVLQIHGFFLDEEKKQIRFDVILDFDLPDRHAAYAALLEDLRQAWPGWSFQVTLDSDISD
ncbi:MAG: cation transporter [Clostridia bacterium]|nr:cation transporter [Clostridia bacterium]